MKTMAGFRLKGLPAVGGLSSGLFSLPIFVLVSMHLIHQNLYNKFHLNSALILEYSTIYFLKILVVNSFVVELLLNDSDVVNSYLNPLMELVLTLLSLMQGN